MIFVTVGTHEQPFNRLVQYVDNLKKNGIIQEEVIIQTGYSTYEPEYCEWQKLFPYQEMLEKVDKARIVITHGGPASFIMPLQVGKIPIVVPRRHEFDEHVNDHQVNFCNAVAKRYASIIAIDHISQLSNAIKNYDTLIKTMSGKQESNNGKFNSELEKLVEEMIDVY